VKILDRYISASVAASFSFGIAMFMVLLLAMSLLKELIELIAEKGIPAATALAIFAFKIPSMLVYAFPMAVLLGIMLTFNRMSSESEMVAIRAGGVSFVRIIMPTLVFALLIGGATYWISDHFVPYASKKASLLTQTALKQLTKNDPISFPRIDENGSGYTITATDLDVPKQQMQKVSVIYYEGGQPAVLIYSDLATWNSTAGRWNFHEATLRMVKPGGPSFWLLPAKKDAMLAVEAYTTRLQESPFDLSTARKKPDQLTAVEISKYIDHLTKAGRDAQEIGKWRMGLVQRYAVPFTCLVFALIGAPLGLRHHRTSSAVGLGISLLVIFAFYFISVYLTTFGESGRMSPILAAWIPNILGGGLGIGLIVKANT